MNWPKIKICKCISVSAACLYMLGCGVKGDPLPPEKPVELGRGRPTYKRATEVIPIEKTKSRAQDEEEEKKGTSDEQGN